MLEKLVNDGIFTRNLRKNLFTIIAKDTKGRATLSWDKYDNNAIFFKWKLQWFATDFVWSIKGVIPKIVTSYTNLKRLPFKTHSSLFAPVSTYTIDNIFDNKNNDEAIKDEIDWLDQVSLSHLENFSSWSKHHYAQVAPSTVAPEYIQCFLQ